MIHWFFWVNAALLGGALNASGPEAFQALLVWMAVVFVSILIHELGHAFAMRQLGDRRVGIVLFAMGGYAQGSLPRTRGQDVWVTAAGPLAQIVGAALVALVAAALGIVWLKQMGSFLEGLFQHGLYVPSTAPLLVQAVYLFVGSSVFWAILNLVPVLPLDGGRIAAAIGGPRGQKAVLGLGMVCALLLAAVLWFQFRAPIGTILFCVLAYNNFQQLRGAPQVPFFGTGR